MKNITKISMLLWFVALVGCSDYLDIAPENVATIEYAFHNRASAEKFLATCYAAVPNTGSPTNDPAMSASHESWIGNDTENWYVANYNPLYLKQGRMSISYPYFNYWDNENYASGGGIWLGIRNCNTFIENLDLVGSQISQVENVRWKAEAKFLKAYLHFYLMRMYGPVPLMKENMPIASTPEQVRTYRDTWDDCVDYVVDLLDEAAKDLPISIENVSIDMGHITRPVALAIKAEVLVTSASPLYNGNDDPIVKNLADNRGVKLFPQSYDPNKWTLAAKACKEAIDMAALANIELYEFNDPNYSFNLSDQTKQVLTCQTVFSDRWNKEVIWALNKDACYNLQRVTMPFFDAAHAAGGPSRPMFFPSMYAAEMFYSKNGVPIDEDVTYDYADRYNTAAATEDQKYYVQQNYVTAKLHMNREPRFYANLAFDGSYWFGCGRYKDLGQGTSSETMWPMRMKAGEQNGGKVSSMRYSLTGYWAKKPVNIRTQGIAPNYSSANQYRYSVPVMRLADLYLLYAEALNESMSAPDQSVYEYIDKVRARAGLKGVVESWRDYSVIANKPSTKEGMREIIHREREIELYLESRLFWDVRRWKTASNIISGPVYAWNVSGSTTSEYYNLVIIDDLSFREKDYWWPIKEYSLRVNTNLVQNPYWN